MDNSSETKLAAPDGVKYGETAEKRSTFVYQRLFLEPKIETWEAISRSETRTHLFKRERITTLII